MRFLRKLVEVAVDVLLHHRQGESNLIVGGLALGAVRLPHARKGQQPGKHETAVSFLPDVHLS
jgi:hypothetical protein